MYFHNIISGYEEEAMREGYKGRERERESERERGETR